MEHRRFYLLENPSAGRARGREFLDALTRALVGQGNEVTTYVGGEPGDLARHAATLEDDQLDVLLVAGGDGTVRSVLNGRDDDLPWPVGVVPVGTANLVARETRMFGHKEPQALAEALRTAEPWSVDLLHVEREDGRVEKAISSVGIGLDGELVHMVAELRGAQTTSGGYHKWVKPAWTAFHDYAFPPLSVQVDAKGAFETALAVVQNARNYGGLFTLSPEARLDSGRMDVVTVKARTALDMLRLGLRAGTGVLHRDRQVRIVPATKVRIRATAAVPVQADGDPAGTTDLEITLRRGALTLLRALA